MRKGKITFYFISLKKIENIYKFHIIFNTNSLVSKHKRETQRPQIPSFSQIQPHHVPFRCFASGAATDSQSMTDHQLLKNMNLNIYM